MTMTTLALMTNSAGECLSSGLDSLGHASEELLSATQLWLFHPFLLTCQHHAASQGPACCVLCSGL